MAKMVTLTIDGVQVTVPEGTLIVNAAKQVGIDIPVFCYHPKMEPVGMCRMCLVEIGRPVIDRATGQMVLEEDGAPKIQFGPKLETACTTPVSEGMVVVGVSDKAKRGRKDIVEFLLTSHPLDCPVCDKGGECPLQNLTMRFGPGESRFRLEEKQHLAKMLPLGELIYLDRERCIFCGRCVRFQSEIADDPVIGFYNRGRTMQIVSYSEPGFDSYWSGNTTDICPVGALTTSDFRFKARPWELRAAASICNHCPVGCNTTLNVRREVVSGGEWVLKRVMPRQNEYVNEIWICDKGRFGLQYATHNQKRLTEPLVRRDGELLPATWDEALNLVAERFKEAGAGLLTLASGRLSNEDLFNLKQFTHKLEGQTALYSHMAGGDLTAQIGLAPGSNFADMGSETAILVVASDLEEEAPLWWLRVKQAAQRGAKLIVLNPRQTKLDQAAKYSLRYPFGFAAAVVMAMVNGLSAKQTESLASLQELVNQAEFKNAVQDFASAENAVVLFGSEGVGLAESETLSQACANLLIATGHTGKPNNGLLAVWSRANDQGAWEMGWTPASDLMKILSEAKALYIAASDPVGDDPAFQSAFGADTFVVVQDLTLTQTARLADVVLPAQSYLEREGSYTSGERRVQRFYPAIQPVNGTPPKESSPGTSKSPVLKAIRPELQGPQADYAIPALLAEKMGIQGVGAGSAASVFLSLANVTHAFKGLTYQRLSQVEEQWPIVGRSDMYYGGTSYENSQGLGVQLPVDTKSREQIRLQPSEFKLPKLGLMAFPITRLYDRGNTLMPSELLHQRIGEPYIVLGVQDAERIKVKTGDMLRITFSVSGVSMLVSARLDETLPERVILAPRSFGLPVNAPTLVEIKAA